MSETCGCKIYPYGNSIKFAIDYCDLHKAAPDMAAALATICIAIDMHTDLKPDNECYAYIQKNYGGGIAEAWRKARAALDHAGVGKEGG